MSTEIDPLTPWKEANMLRCSQSDVDLFNQWTLDLPSQSGIAGNDRYADGSLIPLGSGPHIVQVFRMALAIVATTPPLILEIGFNRGHSSAVWLGLSPHAHVASLDTVNFAEQALARRIVRERFCQTEPRFGFYERSYFDARVTLDNWHPVYDLAFIDGAHGYSDIVTDIKLCQRLAIPWLLFDDWYPRWGETQSAVAAAGLKVAAVLGGMALCTLNA